MQLSFLHCAVWDKQRSWHHAINFIEKWSWWKIYVMVWVMQEMFVMRWVSGIKHSSAGVSREMGETWQVCPNRRQKGYDCQLFCRGFYLISTIVRFWSKQLNNRYSRHPIDCSVPLSQHDWLTKLREYSGAGTTYHSKIKKMGVGKTRLNNNVCKKIATVLSIVVVINKPKL